MSVFRMVIGPPLLGVFLVSAIIAGGSAPLPKHNFCTSNGEKGSVMCLCLQYHPDFCEIEGGLPSCCKATEQGSKAESCHCCPSGKPKSVEQDGMWIHIR